MILFDKNYRKIFEATLADKSPETASTARRLFGTSERVYVVDAYWNDRAYDYLTDEDPERTKWATDDSGVVYYYYKFGNVEA